MSDLRHKAYTCVRCRKRTKPDQRRFIVGPSYKNYRQYLGLLCNKDTDVTCLNCYTKFYRHQKQRAQVTVNSINTDSDDDDYEPSTKRSKTPMQSPQNIPLPILSTGKSHSSCSICKKRGKKYVRLSSEIRHKLFVKTGHLITAGARCCPEHINADMYLTEEALNYLQNTVSSSSSTNTYFNKTEIFNLITDIRAIALRHEKYRIDFDNNNFFNDSDFNNLTGLSKDNFDDLVSHVKTIRSTKNRSLRTCIALLLVKLRTGMSNRMLSTLFNIEKTSIRRSIAAARKELSDHFTSKYLGFNNISRDDVIRNHTRPLAQELFGNDVDEPAILVADGTYIYIQKSNNFQFQRRSYSLHKNRPLVKHMIIVSTTGHIVSVLGPYLADYKNNDASIIKHNFQTNMENIKEWTQEGDIMIVDRGFRDAQDFLQDIGIQSKMPSFLKKGQKQHSVEEANSARLVTKIRWIVESVNGRLKQWKYLQNIVPNTQIPFIGEYVKLVAALCNRYRPPLSSGNKEQDQLLASKMKVLAAKTNELQQRVVEEQLDRRISAWKKMDEKDVSVDFPSLSEEELRELTVGVYQLKLARSYTTEHLNKDGDYEIMLNEDVADILRVKVQSRHTSSKKYML